MTFEEALAAQPAWVGYWVNWLFVGAFILPFGLLVWKETRITGIITLVSSIAAGMGVMWMFEQMGYVKALGVPHILIWTPLAYYLFRQMQKPEMRVWPKRLIAVSLATILVSLVFDYVDAVRYLLGERTPFTA